MSNQAQKVSTATCDLERRVLDYTLAIIAKKKSDAVIIQVNECTVTVSKGGYVLSNDPFPTEFSFQEANEIKAKIHGVTPSVVKACSWYSNKLQQIKGCLRSVRVLSIMEGGSHD